MTVEWTDDQVVLVIDKAELMTCHPEVVDGIWAACQSDDKIGQQVGRFIVLGISIMVRGCLQFIGE